MWTLLICFRPSCHSKRPQLLRTKRFYTTKNEEKPCSDPARTDRRRTVAIILCFQNHNSPQDSDGVSRLQLLILFFSKMAVNVWLRMFFYGLHGFFDEILFTSMLNFAESNFIDWSFRGHSSLWSFFMYGFGRTSHFCLRLYEDSCTLYGCIYGNSAVVCCLDILTPVHGIIVVDNGTFLV